jgi:hypothetical protein
MCGEHGMWRRERKLCPRRQIRYAGGRCLAPSCGAAKSRCYRGRRSITASRLQGRRAKRPAPPMSCAYSSWRFNRPWAGRLKRRVLIGPGVDIQNRSGERLWRLLRKIVTCVRHHAVLVARREALQACLSSRRRRDAVCVAFQRDRGHGNRRRCSFSGLAGRMAVAISWML